MRHAFRASRAVKVAADRGKIGPMLDLIIDRIVGRFLSQTARTAHDHHEALKGHSLLQRVFFPDLKGTDLVPQGDDGFLCAPTDVTC